MRVSYRNTVCIEPECQAPAVTWSRCVKHYRQEFNRQRGTRKQRALALGLRCQICGRAATARQMCSTHYQRFRRGMEMNAPIRSPLPRINSCRECDAPVFRQQLCKQHYNEIRRLRYKQRRQQQLQSTI